MRRVLFGLGLAVVAVAAEQGTWQFDKIAKSDRRAEPVSTGMPFPRGVLKDPALFHLTDEGREVPVQSKITGRWPDGSVRWLFVRALVDLPGNRSRQLTWNLSAPRPAAIAVQVSKLPDGSLEVNTGPLVAKIPPSGFFPLAEVRLNGQPVLPHSGGMQGFVIRTGGVSWSTASSGPVRIEVEENGPVAAVIRVSGRHGGDGSPFDFSARLTFWLGKPYVGVDYRVLALRGEREVAISSWDWSVETEAAQARLRLGYGHYNTRILESTSKVSHYHGPEDFRYDSVEHAFQSYAGDFWCDWTQETAGLAVTLRQAQQNFPKAMEATPAAIRVSLYPATEKEPLRFPVGAAKTHQLLLHFHSATASTGEISHRSLEYQIPDIPRLPPEWYGRCHVWDERVFGGQRSRRIDALVYDTLDNRPVGMGVWNFGDEVDWGYTGQGRGRDDVVWLNNEYDFAHLLFVEFGRSGERRFLDYAAANALHWRDVDIDHASSNPLRRGGHIAHAARHVTGGISPSHQWVEGLIDAYHMLGDREYLDVALGVGDNILRYMALPQYRDPGNASTRDMGWALRAMLALWRETGDERYLAPCRQIISVFHQWHSAYPGLLAPYTDHSMVRVNFMNALTLVSLGRYLRYFPDPALKKLVLEETNDMLEHGRNRNGIFYYKELPSLEHQGSTLLPLQLMAEAYTLSGDRRYLEAGLTELEYALTNMNMRFMVHTGAAEKFTTPSGGYSRVLFYPPGGKEMGISLMPILEFLSAANEPDLTRQVDFRWRLGMPAK